MRASTTGMAWVGMATVVLLAAVIGCTGPNKRGTVGGDAATISIASDGLSEETMRKGAMVLHYIQYSIDGELVGVHRLERRFRKQVAVAPGVHHLYVERASRGILGARAFLEGDGDCYTFSLGAGDTALLSAKALSDREWKVESLEGVRYDLKTCRIDKCRPR